MKSHSDDVILSFTDLKRLFHRTLPTLKKSCLLGGCIACVLVLLREPRFLAEATFKQATPIHESGFQLKDFFQSVHGQMSQDTGAASLMTSRTVLRDVVEKLGMQVTWERSFRITKILARIWENVSLETGWNLGDVDAFVFRKVRYEGEKRESIFIKIVDRETFQLFDRHRNELGTWRLNDTISLPFFTGCLTKIPRHVGVGKVYRLHLLPWGDVIQRARKRFTVKPFKAERHLFSLTFAHRDRYLAADFLNQVMESCQKFIHSENEEIARAQLAYLERRQEELAHKWDGLLHEHVVYLQNNIQEGGYLSFTEEHDHLQEPKNTYAMRLLDVDLELKRLESQKIDKKKKDNPSSHLDDRFLDSKKPLLSLPPAQKGTYHTLEEQKKEIDHQLMTLEFEEAKKEHSTFLKEPTTTSLPASGIAQEILALSQQQREAEELLEQLERGEELTTDSPLFHDRKSLVGMWAKAVTAEKQHGTHHSEGNISSSGKGDGQLANCLRAFIAQTEDKIKVLQDNITVRGATTQEFAGLTLETAQQLYLEYNNQRDGLQAELKQLIYLSEQLYQPQFELSSITAILSDPVTQGLVLHAGETAVRLQDAHNRSLREQEHLKEALHTQKSFIAQHLVQIIELTKLRIKLTEDKIGSLRDTTIGLLKQEKELLTQQLDGIRHKMESLPEKWRRENVLLLKKELGIKMVEGLTHLMETKSIDRHLYQVGSKPLDAALPPLRPKQPHFLFYTLLGALCAGCGSYLAYLFRSFLRGLPVSHQTLALSGFNSCGSLSLYCNDVIEQLARGDLETLRRLAQFLMRLDQKGLCCVILGGKHPNFSFRLAELLSMQKLRTLVVHYLFDKPVHPEETPGLWQYLQGEVADCPVRKQLSFDFLPSGGTNRHSVELLSHPKLLSFLTSVQAYYDVILFYTSAQATDVEGQALLSIADAAIIATSEEKKEDLSPYEAWSVAKGKECVAFVDLGACSLK